MDRSPVWRLPHVFGLCLVGLAVLAAFLPWVEASAGIFSVSKNGIEGDGIITLVAALVVGAVILGSAYQAIDDRTTAAAAMTGGGLIAGIGIYDWINVENKAGEIESSLVSVSAGVGLVLTVVAGLAILGVGLLGFWQRRRSH
jgi:MYXO-CTERM domain-containing protein